MEPIFDRNGRTVAWLEDDVVFDRRPAHRAFIEHGAVFSHDGRYLGRVGAVFSYDGRYLGRLEDRFFRDRSGHAVAFMAGATNGPIPPIAEIAPIPPTPPIPPIHPIPPIPPIPPIASLDWSNLTWDAFLRG